METSESVEGSPGSKPRLKREIGLWMAVALVVGNMVGSGIVVFGAVPTNQLADSSSPFALAAGSMFGGAWTKVVALVAIAATFGALNGWILLTARVPLAAAEDGLFPRFFANVHGKNRTPIVGLVVSSVLVTALMLTNYTKGLVSAFTFVILLATLTTLVPYAFSAAAQAHLYLTEPELFERRPFIRDTLIAALAFVYSVWAITGSGKDIIAKGFVLLLAGIPVYVLVKAWEKRHPVGEAEPGPTPAGAVRRHRLAPRRRMGVQH